MLPRCPSASGPSCRLFLREETSQAACEALHRGQLDCVLLAVPFPAATSISPSCSTIACSSPSRATRRPTPERVPSRNEIDERRLLLLEDGHCLKDHALAACNRPELRAGASMMGTSLHTLVQMVDNGLGFTSSPQSAIRRGDSPKARRGQRAGAGRPHRDSRRIALVWRRSSPREEEFKLLADSLTGLARELAPNLVPAGRSIHVLEADPQIVLAGHQGQRGRGPQAGETDAMDPLLLRKAAAENQRAEATS